MYIPLYVPKSVIYAFLFVVVGALGWILHGSADQATEAAHARADAPSVLALDNAPPSSAHAPRRARDISTVRAHIQGEPGTTTLIGRGPAGLLGQAKTVNSTTWLARTATGQLAAGTAPTPLETGTPLPPPPPSSEPPAQQPPPTSYPIPTPAPAPSPFVPPGSVVVHQPADGGVPIFSFPNTASSNAEGPLFVTAPPSYIEPILGPLPGAKTRGVAFSEWESYRTDVAGRNIIVTTDDSNLWKDRNGKLNGNTGDTDASGLNVTDAVDSVIRGTESADEAPYQTMAQALVDLATGNSTFPPSSSEDDANTADSSGTPEDGPPVPVFGGDGGPLGDPVLTSDGPVTGPTTATGSKRTTPNAMASVVPTARATGGSDDGGGALGFDFPYDRWVRDFSRSTTASAIHTDDGTTLASGQDAVVVGGDGYDDDDNRVAGENLVVTRDDGNIVLGGTGDSNSQIGDSEQGAVIMNVVRTFIQGGGAY